ncbi:MAG: hypothetical protein R2725_11150 [Solirubrobacterales bacterium]
MKQRLRPKLTYANVIATVALFVALGGVATAATRLPKNSVGPNQIKRGAVNAAKLRNEAVRKNKIAPKAVTVGKLGPQAVAPWNIGNGAVLTNKLSNQAVIASKIRNNVVTTKKLNNNAVTQQKLAPEAVGTGNLQSGSVTAGKLAGDVAPLVGTLKSGQTLRGVFSLGGDEIEELRSSESFQFPLLATPATPAANILETAFPTAACPGIGGGLEQTPQASPGNLCIYITEKEGLAGADLEFDPAVTNRLGFGLVLDLGGTTKFRVSGQWAVTAP